MARREVFNRGGGVIGKHDVTLTSDLEMISLSHDAFDRSVFAAAQWLCFDAVDRITGT